MIISVCKKCYLVFIIGALLAVNSVCYAKCDFSKIFRTPKDMRHVNFDHLEIVERSEFDRFETTTTQPVSTTSESSGTKQSRQNDGNVANAQVLLRFGGDNIDGSNHVIKHPPYCQNLLGGSHSLPPATTYNHNYFTPPCQHQYFHPYPPPVPFTFPNYYYSFYDELKPYIPQQLNAYLNRYAGFYQNGIMDYDGTRKMRNKLPCNYNRPNKNKRKLQNLDIQPKRNIIDVSDESEGENLAKSRVSRSLKPSDDVTRDTTINPEVGTTTPKVTTARTTDDKSNGKIISDVNTLLNNALVEYKRDNCSDNHKMLISYPIFGEKTTKSSTNKVLLSEDTSQNQREDKYLADKENTNECACLKYQRNENISKPERKFVKDLEYLMHLSFNDTSPTDDTPPFLQKYLSSMVNILKSDPCLFHDSNSKEKSEEKNELKIDSCNGNDLDNQGTRSDTTGVNNLARYTKGFYNDAEVISPISNIIYKRVYPSTYWPLRDIDQTNQGIYFPPRLVTMMPIDSQHYESYDSPFLLLARRSVIPEYYPKYGVHFQKKLIPNVYDIDSPFIYYTKCGSQCNIGGHCQNCGYSFIR